MKEIYKGAFLRTLIFTILFSLCTFNVQAETKTITSNETGTFEGYDYEYWKESGTGTMTLNGDGTFSCEWEDNCNDIMFRTGKKFKSSIPWQDYGNITIDFACNYQPNGNSYLGAYGQFRESLAEYYIIENYGISELPVSNADFKGNISVDGRTYKVYSKLISYPDIVTGMFSYHQYFSVCTSKRSSGRISVSEHFKAWEKVGMKLGKLYDVSMLVEGMKSKGKADITKMDFNFVAPVPTPVGVFYGDVNHDGKVNSADLLKMKMAILEMEPLLDEKPGDLDGNGSISTLDLLLLKQYILGIIDDFPVQSLEP